MASIDPTLPSEQAWDGTPFQVLDDSGAFDPAATAAALAAYVVDHPAPGPLSPPAAAAPATEFYLSKVDFERRFLPGEFARLDAIRVTVAGRPADWASSTAALWPQYAASGVVEGLLLYADSEAVNVLDPTMVAIVNAMPALGAIAFTDYVAPTDGSTPVTSDQWSAERIAALLATS